MVMVSVQDILNCARKYIGVRQWSGTHKALIDRYNSVLPRPVGYTMTYADDWCDAFVTAVSDEVGATSLIGRECGVQCHIHRFTQLGIWLGRAYPKPGDIITFDWDGGGFADHIGFVEAVSGGRVTTIEGNSGAMVRRNYIRWNDWQVKGYARPHYSSSTAKPSDKDYQLAKEVLDAKWGNGAVRVSRLRKAGHNPATVQQAVNELVKLRDAKEVTIAKHATHWQTGERIHPKVLGKTYKVVGEKAVKQSHSRKAYLLRDGRYYLGWVLDQDVATS
ncbi:CHAP domain-containing protein [Aerococcus sanguinicola]|uniref:CHAP domain-containing protein n=2 Tax=Aerococcus sanguinicola TaxID=119206 RepID=A0A5N1GPX0_9LACT|nr:CHAP domain-containing protein [Aerococcus sanguinicola]